MKEKLKEQKKKSDLAKTEDGKGGIDTVKKAQDKAAMKKLKIGPTYYPQSQNEIQARLKIAFKDKKTPSKDKKNNVGGQKEAHKKRMEKFFDRGLPAGEIAKLDKEFNARMERAIKRERLDLRHRPGMSKLRKKQKGTIPDTGSEYAKGGRAGYKDGKSVEKKGLSSRTKGSDRPSKELDFSKKNFSYSGKEMQADKKARKSRTQSQSRMNPVPYKSGGRTGYSVGGRAMRGVSKILIKK